MDEEENEEEEHEIKQHMTSRTGYTPSLGDVCVHLCASVCVCKSG